MENTKTILVVEDEVPLLEAAAKKLSDAGFFVIRARSVDEAHDYLSKNNISAVWLDHYLLGKKNGLDFVRTIKSEKADKKIPIFVVSNTASPEKVDEYMALGVTKYYTKADHKLEDIINDIKETLK